MMYLLLFLLGLVSGLSALLFQSRFLGFPTQKVEEYADNLPVLDLRTHLNGPLLCEGAIFGPTGRVSSRFRADMNVVWDGPKGVMSEHFIYDDGSTQNREWHLTLGTDGSLRAEASDVIGAGSGAIAGNALGLRYRIKLPETNGGHVLDAVDWMYLQPDGLILNRSQFRKFGIKVAELFCTIRPLPQESNNA